MTTISTETSSSQQPQAKWCQAVSLDDLAVGARYLFREGDQRIAVFRVEKQEIYAVDDRCPHEGYPLTKGSLDGTVVSCQWHNFKFELSTGKCLKGDENVRIYPTRVRDGLVELNLVEQSSAAKVSATKASLREGLSLGRMGQVSRDCVRLLQLGMPPEELAFLAATFDAERGEYGTTHVLPVVVDSLRALPRYSNLQAVLPILQGMELAADFHLRQPRRERLTPRRLSGKVSEVFAELRDLVEREKGLEAEAVLAGAIEGGADVADIERWFYHLCSDHFLGFGHALIYTQKAFELLHKVGWNRAIEILPAVLFNIVNQTREELLPEWKWFCVRLNGLEQELSAIYSAPQRAATDGEVSELVKSLLDGKREQAFDALAGALRSGLEREAIADSLCLAASERILRFDVEIDATSTEQEGWLDVTHILTFASAVRQGLARFEDPAVLKLLFFAGRFINNAKPLDLKPDERLSVSAQAGQKSPSLAEIRRAVASQQTQEAVSMAATYCSDLDKIGQLWDVCEDFAMSDKASKPIVIGHLIKTCQAAFREAIQTGDNVPILAFIKVASSPVRQRWVTRLAHEAISFLEHGKVPRTLT